jgi:hypothetical protein
MNVSTLAERKILGVICSDLTVKLACAHHMNRMGGRVIFVDVGEDAISAFDLYVDAILVDNENLVQPCQKPLLVTTNPTRESLLKLLYNS